MDAIQTIPLDDMTEMEVTVPKKGKVDEVVQLSEKEQKILKVAKVCGVDLPYADRSKNFMSETFGTCGTTWCRGTVPQKHCLTVLAQTVLGLGMKDFVKIAMEWLPAAQKEFAELYGKERL